MDVGVGAGAGVTLAVPALQVPEIPANFSGAPGQKSFDKRVETGWIFRGGSHSSTGLEKF